MTGPTDQFWTYAGQDLVILALCLGVGGCFHLAWG